jgi:hypothetical protein
MDDERIDLIKPNEIAFHLELTAAQLKVTHTALKTLLDDLGHDEADVRRIVQDVVAKFPDEASIRAIDLDREIEALRRSPRS